MTTASDIPTARWNHWYRRALPAYWIFLFCITHFPLLKLEVSFSMIDKVAHCTCWGLLAFLFWRFAETFNRPLSNRFIWLALVWIGLYSVVDEWLQPFVGRGADVTDWLADMLGATAVLTILEWHRRRRQTRPANAGFPGS